MSKKTIAKAVGAAAAVTAVAAAGTLAARRGDPGVEVLRPGRLTVQLPAFLTEAGFPVPSFSNIPDGEANMYSVSGTDVSMWFYDVERSEFDSWLADLQGEGRDVRYNVEATECGFECFEDNGALARFGRSPRRFDVWPEDGIDDEDYLEQVEVHISRSFFDAAGVRSY